MGTRRRRPRAGLTGSCAPTRCYIRASARATTEEEVACITGPEHGSWDWSCGALVASVAARRLRQQQLGQRPRPRQSARSLLKQTFGGAHTVKSGVLGFTLTMNPSGSSTLTTPISFSLTGPFQSRGTGKLPASDFTIGISRWASTARSASSPPAPAATSRLDGTRLSAARGRLPAPGLELLAARSPRRVARSACPGSASTRCTGSRTRRSSAPRPSAASRRRTSAPASTSSALLADLNTFLAKAAKSVGHAPRSRARSRRRPSRRSPPRSRTPPSTSGPARATRRCASCR